MFTFLNPIFLYAAVATVVPLVLHMMEKRRRVRLQFSYIRFLQMAEKKSSHRIQLENFLLWLMRTLLIAFVVLALAAPILRTKSFGAFLGRTDRDVAIVIDNSYSMKYIVGREDVWNKAIETASSIINGLSENDNICVFVANDDVVPVLEHMTKDKQYALSILKTLEAGTTESQLCPAVIAAYDSLKRDIRQRDREIHIITDGQELPWQSFARTDVSSQSGKEEKKTTGKKEDKPKKDEKNKKENPEEAIQEPKSASIDMWKPDKIDKRTAFFVTLTGVTTPENIAPVDVKIEPQLIMPDTPCKVKVTIKNSGPSKNTSAKLSVDNKEIAERAIVIGEDGSEEVTLAIPPMEPGDHAAKIETATDSLADDNSFHFLIHVKDKLPTLCIGSKDDLFFLLKAMNADQSSGSAIKPDVITPAQLAETDLTQYSCVFACNALPLQGQEILELENYVKAGALLVIFPGDRAAPADYQPWSCLPSKPSGITDLSINDRKKILSWIQPQHPLLRRLKLRPGIAPTFSARKSLIWGELDKKAKPLISAGGDDYFLVEFNPEKGSVLMFSVAADRSWSTFPLSPFYLPIIHQVVQYGAGLIGIEPYIWATRTLSVSEQLPNANEQSSLSYPDGKRVPTRSSIVNNKTVLRAENVMTPGIYSLSKPDSGEPQPALAVNINRTESNLATANKEEIIELIGTKSVYVATGKDELKKIVDDYRVGRSLGELILWLVLALSVCEAFYANQKAKESTKLSSALGIEASGKISGG